MIHSDTLNTAIDPKNLIILTESLSKHGVRALCSAINYSPSISSINLHSHNKSFLISAPSNYSF